MCRVLEWEVLECIRPGGMKKCILLRELHQAFLGFFMMHKTETPLVIVAKDVQKEGIKMRMNF